MANIAINALPHTTTWVSSAVSRAANINPNFAVVCICTAIGIATLQWIYTEKPKSPPLSESQRHLGCEAASNYASMQKAQQNAAAGTVTNKHIIPSAKDGNCLYTSFRQHLAFQGIREIPDTQNLRSWVADFLSKGIHAKNVLIMGLLNEAIDDHNDASEWKIRAGDFSHYLQKVRQMKFYGGGAEAYALATLFNVPLHVYTKTASENEHQLVAEYNCSSSAKPAVLIRDAGISHYDLLID